MRLILASSSPRRQQLLRQIIRDFDVFQPRIDERRLPDEPPIAYAERLSREKALSAADASGSSRALILSADTIVIAPDGDLLGKPADAADASRMLKNLRNRQHQVVTAFTLRRQAPPEREITRHERTLVFMRDYSDAEIAAYIASGDPFDKAGAYAIQNPDFRPAARIEGSYSNVVGLPIAELRTALREIGWMAEPGA